jgi:hypothetical protein
MNRNFITLILCSVFTLSILSNDSRSIKIDIDNDFISKNREELLISINKEDYPHTKTKYYNIIDYANKNNLKAFYPWEEIMIEMLVKEFKIASNKILENVNYNKLFQYKNTNSALSKSINKYLKKNKTNLFVDIHNSKLKNENKKATKYFLEEISKYDQDDYNLAYNNINKSYSLTKKQKEEKKLIDEDYKRLEDDPHPNFPDHLINQEHITQQQRDAVDFHQGKNKNKYTYDKKGYRKKSDKKSMEIGTGYGKSFLQNNLKTNSDYQHAWVLYIGACLYDFFIDFNIQLGETNSKIEFENIQDGEKFKILKGEDLSMYDLGLKIGYFAYQNKLLRLSPYISLSHFLIISDKHDGNYYFEHLGDKEEEELKLVKSVGYGFGLRNDLILYDSKDLHVFIRFDAGYKFIPDYKDERFKGDWANFAVSLGFAFWEY